ncbi:MAG: BON domain-containing protein [Acidobacteriota bacterium]
MAAGLTWALVLSVAMAAGVGEPYQDTDLERAARSRLQRRPDLRGLRLRVSVRSAVAHLEGEVEALEQALSARRAVAAVRGLIDLQDKLVVPAGMRSDERLQRDLEREIERFPSLRDLDLRTRVEQGTAILEGSTRTAGERRLVLEAVRRVRGVRAIELRLQAKQGSGDSDARVEAQVRGLLADRLRFPIQGRVSVQVKDRVAILQGRVQRVIDRLEAEEVAWFVAGVRGVQNQITVRPRPRLWRAQPASEGSGDEAPEQRPLRSDPETPESMPEEDADNGV